MAPARMVQFIKQHVASCAICQEDPDIQDEIVKITEIILPESKIPKAVRLQQEKENIEAEEEIEKEKEKDELQKAHEAKVAVEALLGKPAEFGKRADGFATSGCSGVLCGSPDYDFNH